MSGDAILALEAPLRLSVFAALFLLLAVLERVHPCRGDARPARRQGVNLGLAVLDSLVLRLGFPMLAVGFAVHMQLQGIGLLPWLGLAGVPAFLLALLLLDLGIYGQHRLLHAVPLLWRLHRVHHADLGFDTTLGVRFHPLEMVLSLALKCGLIALLGAPPLAVLVFEVLLSAGALFTHADLALPTGLERTLRRVLVTPAMHRVHHSVHRDETDSNFGFHLALWDHLFRSYRAAPRDGHTAMRIGLPQYRDPAAQTLTALLLNPFRDASRPSPPPE